MTDRSIFFVIEMHKGEQVLAPTNASMTRKEMIALILNGEIDPHTIIEVIQDEQVVNTITADIASDLKDIIISRGEGCPDHLVDFIEANTDGFVRRAA